ncbi:hypothetical protein K1Y77_17215 (plasmid) [Halomonas qaidamensis]|uniref:Uncharacterized protein n=1 Tax=Halomonas qaidamensis TaxID=2866211 RepID=A0ABY6JVU7_9GAMM|nr:hypothetical protein K1Y77_17215 [Halomonas qaidamensis]
MLRLAALGSQLVNVIAFDGSPDETVSGRAYRQGVLQGCAKWERRRRWINRAFWWQTDHCRGSHLQDLRMARAITALYD